MSDNASKTNHFHTSMCEVTELPAARDQGLRRVSTRLRDMSENQNEVANIKNWVHNAIICIENVRNE